MSVRRRQIEIMSNGIRWRDVLENTEQKTGRYEASEIVYNTCECHDNTPAKGQYSNIHRWSLKSSKKNVARNLYISGVRAVLNIVESMEDLGDHLPQRT